MPKQSAGLLLFRLLYYITPFAIALVILGGREFWLSMTRARRASAAKSSKDHDA